MLKSIMLGLIFGAIFLLGNPTDANADPWVDYINSMPDEQRMAWCEAGYLPYPPIGYLYAEDCTLVPYSFYMGR